MALVFSLLCGLKTAVMLSKLGASALVAILCATRAVYGAVPELPPIPTDLSTPVSQRIAFHGPTGAFHALYARETHF